MEAFDTNVLEEPLDLPDGTPVLVNVSNDVDPFAKMGPEERLELEAAIEEGYEDFEKGDCEDARAYAERLLAELRAPDPPPIAEAPKAYEFEQRLVEAVVAARFTATPLRDRSARLNRLMAADILAFVFHAERAGDSAALESAFRAIQETPLWKSDAVMPVAAVAPNNTTGAQLRLLKAIKSAVNLYLPKATAQNRPSDQAYERAAREIVMECSLWSSPLAAIDPKRGLVAAVTAVLERGVNRGELDSISLARGILRKLGAPRAEVNKLFKGRSAQAFGP